MKFGITYQKSILTAALLLLVMPVFQSVYASSSQSLSMNVFGSTLNAGDQKYNVVGGQLVFASIAGQTIDPSTAQLQYALKAEVEELSTDGQARFQLSGSTADGTAVVVKGDVEISDMVAAAQLPLGCTTSCNSALPFFFVGASDVQVTIGVYTQKLTTTMQLESPYFNPWGAPIVIASTDSSIVMVATYTQGTIQWSGTKLGGVIGGTLGGKSVTGIFNMTSRENEDLVAGTAVDHGTISFKSMNPSFLNTKGEYQGNSVIPQAGASDCSSLTGFPGTCTQTGFQSTGQFSMHSEHDVSIDNGIYGTQWGVPALGFAASVSATVTQK